MFIDASALTVLTDEDEARELLARPQQTGTRLISPLAVWDAFCQRQPRRRSKTILRSESGAFEISYNVFAEPALRCFSPYGSMPRSRPRFCANSKKCVM